MGIQDGGCLCGAIRLLKATEGWTDLGLENSSFATCATR